jgi:hypothetical protein
MVYVPERDRPLLLSALDRLKSLVEQPIPEIRCGDSDPDPGGDRSSRRSAEVRRLTR